MSFACPHCGAVVADQAVDRAREIATCGSCQRLIDLRPQIAAQTQAAAATAETAPARPRMRAPVGLPAGMTLNTQDGFVVGYRAGEVARSVVITRRWLRAKHFVMLVVFVGLSVAVGYLWTTLGYRVWLLIATFFLVSFDLQLLTMFLNTTRVSADAERINVKHGPLPSIQSRNRELASSSVKQLYAAKSGALFAVKAQLTSGETVDLVAPLVSEEQALFVEQQLEQALGITDYEMPGELNSQLPEAKPVPGGRASKGSGVAGVLLVLLLPVGGVLFFFVVSNSQASGTLTYKAAAGAWSFSPDDCDSGQRGGFVGVELYSEKDKSRVVRLVKDPVRGNLLVMEAAGSGQPTTLAESAGCKVFKFNFERTSTSINEVVVVEGDATIECPAVQGQLKFEGCH